MIRCVFIISYLFTVCSCLLKDFRLYTCVSLCTYEYIQHIYFCSIKLFDRTCVPVSHHHMIIIIRCSKVQKKRELKWQMMCIWDHLFSVLPPILSARKFSEAAKRKKKIKIDGMFFQYERWKWVIGTIHLSISQIEQRKSITKREVREACRALWLFYSSSASCWWHSCFIFVKHNSFHTTMEKIIQYWQSAIRLALELYICVSLFTGPDSTKVNCLDHT